MNIDNKRGPKGANLAVFCIPNSFYDQQVLDLAQPYGNVVFCQVATHRDNGQSRGYAFVSYETIEEAQKAIDALHNFTVEGRALRVEVARSDRDAKPY
jgi:RNA recognition motif-containing protein